MKSAEDSCDVVIIGSGIVGASIACAVAPRRRVVLLDQEGAAGYHSTGRSAAVLAPSYGPAAVRALTRASRPYFNEPSTSTASPLLRARGLLFVGTGTQRAAVLSLTEQLTREGHAVELLTGDAVRARVSVLRSATVAVHDPDAYDIDVDGLLQSFLRAAKSHGAQLRFRATVVGLARRDAQWHISLEGGQQIRSAFVVNAAGAWADEVAKLAGARCIGLEPRRRTAFLFSSPDSAASDRWPVVLDVGEQWYLKPEAGRLLASPANADPVSAHDVVAEEVDVALGIHRIESATSLVVGRPIRAWAGLRSFVPDGNPVCGFDDRAPAFFWAAGLGGYGIQTSPAIGQLTAALLTGESVPADLAAHGLNAAALRPSRFA